MTGTIAAEVAPGLDPQIEDAPGQGILPGISPHLAGQAQLFRLEDQPREQLNPLLQRQFLQGTNATFVKWTAKKGAVIALHHPPNEQITWFTAGRAEVFSQGRRYLITAGDIMIIPPNVPHEFRFLDDSVDIDIFAPGRQDWLDGTAAYLDQQ